MRIRAVVVVSLIILGLSIGCRNALTPVDRNRPPETWITGAPQDTITLRDRGTFTPGLPQSISAIRHHLYWAGSDVDGAVVGFYWAVVETLPVAPEGTGGIPPLPGPRTSQYRYTARTDSTFSFTVSEFSPARRHAFFIYAVDDKGRGDPTPARFTFDALDRFPPLPVFDVAQGAGKYATVTSHGVVDLRDVVVAIRDTLDPLNAGRAPSDTIPSGARIDFRWHGEPTIAGNYAVRYKYKLDEPVFVSVDSSVTSVSYNTGLANDAVNAGTKVFTLRAIDAAGGARTPSKEITRRFHINKNPVTWYAGPDSNLVPVVNDPVGHRYLTMSNWASVPSGSGSLLSCDSLYYWPSERPERKTFWEIYRDKLFLRVENDTVHMNSFVVIQGGGADLDSPYAVKVRTNDPPDTAACGAEMARVLRPGGPNGSPIGFRFQYAQVLDFDTGGSPSIPSPSALYPRYDAASPDRVRQVHGYATFTQSGRVYFILRAVDGDDAPDDRLPEAYNARVIADAVDACPGCGTATERALREQLILTFYVNRVPYFDVGQPLFFPKPPQYNGGVTATSPDRVLRMNLPAIDPDPYDPANKPASPGYPSLTTVLRTQVTVKGSSTSGRDTTYTAPRQFTPAYNIDLVTDAPYITGTNLMLTIELCDCANCEQTPGNGRCVLYGPIPVNVPAAAALGADTLTRPTGTKPQDTSSRSQKP